MTTRDPAIEFRVGTLAPPSGLDPRTAKDTTTHTLLRQIFEPLFVMRGGKAVPFLLAEPLRTDGATQSARVAPGVVFSDGTPLTAELMARSLSRSKPVTDKAAVRHEGDRVIFELREPNPRFDLLLTQTYCSIVLERDGQLFGTGAFMFERPPILRTLQAAPQVRLIRNPHHRPPATMQELVFAIYPPDASGAPTQLLEAAARGDIDFTAALTSATAAKVPMGVVYPSIQSGVSTAFLSFNTATPLLSDRRVRRALALALDKTAIAKQSFEKNPLAFVGKDILPPAIDSPEIDLFPHNALEARRLLGEPDVKKPDRLRLMIPWSPRPYAPNPPLIGEEIARQLAQFGVEVTVTVPRSSDDYYASLAGGRYDLVFSGWIPDTPDPADTYDSLLRSDMVPRIGGSNANANNLSRIENAALDAALTAFRRAPTDTHKAAIRRVVQEEAPLAPLLKGQAVVVLSRRVRNFEHSPDGVYALGELTINR